MLSAKEIRQTFFDFFKSKNHTIEPSAPIVLKDDPTLMFTNAGMNQFKDIFLGIKDAKTTRIANSQKCLRVSGKHNDLEEVGVDTYHHTMFEMLGNWSFGDYFKQEACSWAWELLVVKYKLDPNRLYVTIFGGDSEDNLALDEEAKEIWKAHIAEDRILAFGKKDNFWEMGDIGPCGPCSEIHIDLRTEEERKKVDGKTLVNADHPQVIEIWNLVFIEYERKKNKSLIELPQKHIDTGMGFERLVRALQGKSSNYDTDVFQPLILAQESIAGFHYGKDEKKDIAFRVVADHLRAVAFTIADGQLPSNTGAGYVIRRILRRAIRYAYSYLDIKDAFMYSLIPLLCDQFKDVFPELKSQKDFLMKIIKEEEVQFYNTLDKGIHLFQDELERLGSEKVVSGAFAFKLYDTYGFPFDLTLLMAKENQKSVDEEGFQNALLEQKQRSKKATHLEVDDWQLVNEGSETEFIGYDYMDAQNCTILKYRKVKSKDKTLYQIVLDKTPFYPEGGGQVGDIGTLTSNDQNKVLKIIDTKKENNQVIHVVEEEPTVFNNLIAAVDKNKRELTKRNHSATHLLHESLREVLGTHVEQRGSLVNDTYLRFDFSHFKKLEDEEMKEIEALVNQKILDNLPLNEKRKIAIEKAKEMGAMALFGEKYGDEVRVIQFGSSVELCGGTHVHSTSEIGLFKIKSESSVAAGIRRIEALTSLGALNYLNKQEALLNDIKQDFKNPKDLKSTLQNLLAENNQLKKELEEAQKNKAMELLGTLQSKSETLEDIHYIVSRVDVPASAIKDLIFELKKKESNVVLLANEANGKATLSLGISDNLVKEKQMHAGNIIRELAKEIQGGGGGQPFFATAGGNNVEGIENALKKIKEFITA